MILLKTIGEICIIAFIVVITFCICSILLMSLMEFILPSKRKEQDKKWMYEKCGTNTPPKEVPKESPSTRLKSLKELNIETNKDIQEQKEIKKRMAPMKVSEGFWCIYKNDVYVLVEQNGFLPVLKLMEFQDLDEKYRWLEQWNH